MFRLCRRCCRNIHPSSFIPHPSMGPNRPNVLQRYGDADVREVLLRGNEDEIAPELEGHAVARAVAAEEIALFEELSFLRVEVDLNVGADSIPQQRRAGVDPDL